MKKPLFLLAVFAFSSSFGAPVKLQPIRNSPYQLALPGYKFAFPRDHASHRAYSTEWWYYTGHLRARDGRRFGYQLTWFRQALLPKLVSRKSKWATRDVFFAHFAVTDENGQRFFFTDKIARGAAGIAGATDASTINASSANANSANAINARSAKTNSMKASVTKVGATRAKNAKSSTRFAPRIWLGDWSLRFDGARQFAAARGQSDDQNTKNTPFSLQLTQTPLKNLVVHGENGVSQKAAGLGHASHYYSFTRLKTSGQLKIGDETLQVEGQSWFDHEFGSNQLTKNQIGWDWFSLQLDDGRELMLYRMRLRGGGTEPFSSGTLVEKNGQARNLSLRDFSFTPLSTWKSAVSNTIYPGRWRVRVPRAKLDLLVEPTLAAQELITARSTGVTYWEGSVRVLDAQQRRVGQGYVELTGYNKPFSGTF